MLAYSSSFLSQIKKEDKIRDKQNIKRTFDHYYEVVCIKEYQRGSHVITNLAQIQ